MVVMTWLLWGPASWLIGRLWWGWLRGSRGRGRFSVVENRPVTRYVPAGAAGFGAMAP